MKLYDTVVEGVKTTLPHHLDRGYLPLLLFTILVCMGQVVWIIQFERFYNSMTSEGSCWARRLRQRMLNRKWNNRILAYTTRLGLDVFPAADATFSAYVGDIDTLNDMNGAPDGNGDASV